MKKFLPLFIIIGFVLLNGLFPKSAYSQPPLTIKDAPIPQSSTQSNTATIPIGTPAPGTWVADPEVTFVGKSAARAGTFLDWSLSDYHWSSGAGVALTSFWISVRNIIYIFIILIIPITSFVIIVTRGRGVTLPRFIMRFIFVVILIFFSFTIIQFIYQTGDIVQEFFLRKDDGKIIAQADLLNISFPYEKFQGFKLYGSEYEESAFVSLLLVKLTAVTYYVMSGILLIRKIILWFFIVLSPIFPLLLFYYPLRNTAKIWVGEFFRWLLYAPLFAVLLGGLVKLWKASTPTAAGIPLNFCLNPSSQSTCQQISGMSQAPGQGMIYPTAVNILLGGPGQSVFYTQTASNSINLPSTFALYVVSLLMLWVVILLPFLLLQIFLNYLFSISWADNNVIKQIIATGGAFMNRTTPFGPTPKGGPPSSYQPAGMAKALPFTKAKATISSQKTTEVEIPTRTTISTSTNTSTLSSKNQEIIKLANIPVPTMRDIARYETNILSKDITQHQTVVTHREVLEKIANPTLISSPMEREQYRTIQQQLVSAQNSGNALAGAILNAARTVTPVSQVASSDVVRLEHVLRNITRNSSTQQVQLIRQQITAEKQQGNLLASRIMALTEALASGTSHSLELEKLEHIEQLVEEGAEKQDKLALLIKDAMGQQPQALEKPSAPAFPVLNRVQQVNLDDYEAVRKMWEENYHKLDVPQSQSSSMTDRLEWIKKDIETIRQTIALLVSQDKEQESEGMKAVSKILPFLLIGGFSQTEVVAYLKAKQEAAESVLEQLQKQEEEEETKVGVEKSSEEKPKEMVQHEEVSENVGEKPYEKSNQTN